MILIRTWPAVRSVDSHCGLIDTVVSNHIKHNCVSHDPDLSLQPMFSSPVLQISRQPQHVLKRAACPTQLPSGAKGL